MEWASILSVVLIFTIVLIAALYRLSTIIWTGMLGTGLILVTYLNYIPIRGVIFFWICYLASACFANLHGLRRRYITGPLLKRIKTQLPSISNTEREAIEAGDTWWEKDLFCGRPDWHKLYKIPAPKLSEEEHHFLDNQVEQLCEMCDDWNIVYHHADLPAEIWDYIKKEKFFGMVIPKKYNGLGFSALGHSTVIAKIATRSISAAVDIMVPNSLGPAELLLRYGTPDQKNHYLPRLAVGEEIPCFALTAATAGSDAGSITDTAIVCHGEHNGKETIGIKLNWDKRYITLAPIATVLGLAVHMYDPEHLLSEQEDIGITLCLIPTSHPGVEIGNRHLPLQMAFMNGPTRGKDVFIPLEWIIGGKEMAGNGWRMLMECLSVGRSISLPALATASSKLAYYNTGAYARIRRQFNTGIYAFEGIEESLGIIAGNTYLLESTRLLTATGIDTGVNPSIASAIAKYNMTELGRVSVNHAMDVHAGHMIQMGPRNFLANVHISMPISITVEGANILTRNLIIFGQGAIRCHPYLLEEIELMSQPMMDVKKLDKVLMKHLAFFICNLLRGIGYGLSGGLFIFAKSKNARIRKLERQLTRMSTGLALYADASLILLGGSLKRRERISARLGDVLSQLYLASAALKYFNDNEQTKEAANYASWAIKQCLFNIQQAFNDLANNFPIKGLGHLLKWFIFPFGQAYYRPDDKLNHMIVATMTEPSAFRQQLAMHCFVSKNTQDLCNRLQRALSITAEIDPLRKRLSQALKHGKIPAYYTFTQQVKAAEIGGVLTPAEVKALLDYDELYNEIIKVNEFTFDLEQIVA